MQRYVLSIFIFSLCILVIGCSNATANENNRESKNLEPVSLILDWTPNTNHTGIYVAKEKGYYEDLGLEVEILLPGEVSAEQLVAAKKGDFGISFQQEVTQARAEDMPIVSIAAIMQHDTSGYASPVEKDITTPKDFEGKVYGAYGSSLEESMIDLVMKRDDADVSQVDIVQLGTGDFFVSTKRDIDFVSIFYGWTGIEAELREVDINFIPATDYAEELDRYAPLIIASEAMIAEQPETVQAFVEATAKGYTYAIGNPEEAAEILIEAEADLDPELVKRSQEWVSPRYQDDAEQWGIQELKRWEEFAAFMYGEGIIEKEINAADAFTNEFVKNVN